MVFTGGNSWHRGHGKPVWLAINEKAFQEQAIERQLSKGIQGQTREKADSSRDSNGPRVTDEGAHQFGPALRDETDGHGKHDAQSKVDSGLYSLFTSDGVVFETETGIDSRIDPFDGASFGVVPSPFRCVSGDRVEDSSIAVGWNPQESSVVSGLSGRRSFTFRPDGTFDPVCRGGTPVFET